MIYLAMPETKDEAELTVYKPNIWSTELILIARTLANESPFRR